MGTIGRSREGAWIEIGTTCKATSRRRVAPVRERGLKLQLLPELTDLLLRRSREGAWIEMLIGYQLFIVR